VDFRSETDLADAKTSMPPIRILRSCRSLTSRLLMHSVFLNIGPMRCSETIWAVPTFGSTNMIAPGAEEAQ